MPSPAATATGLWETIHILSGHPDRLVHLAGVGGEDVLEDRLNGLGYVGVGDGDEVVVHGQVPSRIVSEKRTALLRGGVLPQELSHEVGDLVAVFLQGEVPGVE